jgi:hypothetical protein
LYLSTNICSNNTFDLIFATMNQQAHIASIVQAKTDIQFS